MSSVTCIHISNSSSLSSLLSSDPDGFYGGFVSFLWDGDTSVLICSPNGGEVTQDDGELAKKLGAQIVLDEDVDKDMLQVIFEKKEKIFSGHMGIEVRPEDGKLSEEELELLQKIQSRPRLGFPVLFPMTIEDFRGAHSFANRYQVNVVVFDQSNLQKDILVVGYKPTNNVIFQWPCNEFFIIGQDGHECSIGCCWNIAPEKCFPLSFLKKLLSAFPER